MPQVPHAEPVVQSEKSPYRVVRFDNEGNPPRVVARNLTGYSAALREALLAAQRETQQTPNDPTIEYGGPDSVQVQIGVSRISTYRVEPA